ncbi:hypothetical protein N9W09_00605 [Crocinitomicaceae bacterium]|nr:hypothetical protein [Crocinitomicaceae bacterium]
MSNQYRKLPYQGGSPREISEVVNNAMEGKINSTGTVTLASGGATSTTITDKRIGAESVILFMPISLSAAATNYYPFGTFENDSTVTFSSADTPQVIALTDAHYAYGMSLASNRITVSYAGLYDIDLVALFSNSNSQIKNAFLWIRVNGTDYAHSGQRFAVVENHGSTDGYQPIAMNHPIELDANDYIEVVGAVSHTDVQMEAFAAQTTPFAMPSIPSIMANLTMIEPSQSTGSAFELYVSSQTTGSATLSHLPNTETDKTYRYLIIG